MAGFHPVSSGFLGVSVCALGCLSVDITCECVHVVCMPLCTQFVCPHCEGVTVCVDTVCACMFLCTRLV